MEVKNGDQPFPRVTQVSINGTSLTEQPPLKDKSMWSDQEKKIQKIDRLARSLLIQDRKAVVLYEYETFKATEGELLLDTYILSKRKDKVVVSSDSDGSDDELKKITALLAKAFNRKKFYSKPTNNNLRTSSATSSANKKQEYVKSDDKKEEKKVDEKKKDMSKFKCYNYKKEGHFAKDCKKAKAKDYEYYKIKMLLAKKDKDEQKVLSDSKKSSSSSDKTIVESAVDHDDSKEKIKLINQLIKECDKKTSKYQKRLEKANQQSKNFENQNKVLQEKCHVFQNQATSFEEKNNELNEQIKVLIEKNDDLLTQTTILQEQLKVKHVVIDTHVECQAKYAKFKAERYEYMIRYSAYFDNDKQHRKQIDDQEILFDKMSYQLVEMNKDVFKLKDNLLEKETKISELKECVRNKDLEIEMCLERLNDCENKLYKIRQTNQTIYMIMPSKDKLYNGQKGIGFENPSYFCKAKDLRPTLYDERQTSSLKSYVSNVILEKIIIDLEDEVVSLLDKEKGNLKTIESLKTKCSESSENANSDSENQSENDCHVVENVYDDWKNSNVIAPGMFKLSVSQSDLPISVSKMSCASNKVETKIKRKRRNRNSSKQHNKQVNKDVLRANKDFIHFSDLDTFSSVRRPKIVHIFLWIIDLGCSKHVTGNYTLLINFVEKFLGMVRFGNNDFAVIACYEDVVIGSMSIMKVYYVKRLDEASEVIISFIKKSQVNLQLQVERVRTDNGTEFKNKTLATFFDELKAKRDIRVFVGYSKDSVAFRVYNKRTRKIHESVNVNFDEVSEKASKQFSLETGLTNLNEKGKSSNPIVSQVEETSKKDLEDLFHNFYDEYFNASKISKSLTTNVETSNNEGEVFHEVSDSFQGESSSSLINDDVQSSKEVIIPQLNTQSILNDMIPNVSDASSSHNVFNERLEDSHFDTSTVFHDTSNVHEFYQPYPHEQKWTKDHPLHKIIDDPKLSLRTRVN
nr:integrase, catalytic region, zinc finger, CCHC-type, peptidase aspartic, catalytic [Tanacetum cinerariifolium]